MKTLVVTSCTSNKITDAEDKIKKEDFKRNKIVKEPEKKNTYKAVNLYAGRQHLHVKEGVSLLRKTYGKEIVDLKIISAKYGLIDENREICPYNLSFSNMSAEKIDNWSKKLNINEELDKIIQNYKLTFFLLGADYLRSLKLPLDKLKSDQHLIFLASKTGKKYIPDHQQYYYLEVSINDAKDYGKNLIELKGYLFKLLAREISSKDKDILAEIYKNPDKLLDIIKKYKKKSNQMKLF